MLVIAANLQPTKWQKSYFPKDVSSDLLSGNNAVTYYELNSIYGHDTFLLDLNGVGAGIKVRGRGSGVMNKPLVTFKICSRCFFFLLNRFLRCVFIESASDMHYHFISKGHEYII